MQQQREELLEILTKTLQAHTWQSYRHGMELAERTGLTMPQFMVLAALNEQGKELTMQDLIHLTMQSGAALTGIIERLQSAKLVTRQPHPQDRRMVLVTITDQGRTRLAELSAEGKAAFARITTAFTNEEVEQLTLLLQKLMDGISEEIEADRTNLSRRGNNMNEPLYEKP